MKRKNVVLLLAVAGGVVVAACSNAEDDPVVAGVCPTCEPSLGGETSDFPGAGIGPCGLALRRRELNGDEVASLAGFDLDDIRGRIEQPIDMPLRWQAQSTDHSSIEGAYPRETRVTVATRIVSYTYDDLDPAMCDGSTCTINGTPTACDDRNLLRVVVENRLRAVDDSIEATLLGAVDVWADDGVVLRSSSFIDLRDVQGTFRVKTDVPRPAHLRLDIEYTATATSGYVAPEVVLSNTGEADVHETPISGRWGRLFTF